MIGDPLCRWVMDLSLGMILQHTYLFPTYTYVTTCLPTDLHTYITSYQTTYPPTKQPTYLHADPHSYKYKYFQIYQIQILSEPMYLNTNTLRSISNTNTNTFLDEQFYSIGIETPGLSIVSLELRSTEILADIFQPLFVIYMPVF